MIDVEQGLSIMLPRITSQTRHPHYERTVNRRKLYHAMMTGEGMEDYLTRFECREDKEQFEARKFITQECVTPAIGEAAGKFYKTSRYPNIKKEISYGTNKTKVETLQEILEKFCDNGDVQSYLAAEFDMRSLIDPNAFLIIDFTDFDALQNQRPGTYGVFIPCDNVVEFEHLPNGELSFLIIERYNTVFDKNAVEVVLKDYIGYLGNDVLIFEQQNENRKINPQPNGYIKEVGDSEYYIYAIQPKAGQVQAQRIGYLKDPITYYKTCVSPLNRAETVVMDLNNDKSEYDMVKRFHVFPQKFQYVQKCPGQSAIVTCNHGLTADGSQCSTCKGKGVLIHSNSSDVIMLPMPTSDDDYIVPLAEMIHYAKPDIEIIQHLREDVNAAKDNIMRAVFSAESVMKQDGNVKIEQTATGANIKADDANNTLLPFCEHKSKVYKFIIRQIALFNDMADNLKILFEYPASLRLETVEELQEKFSLLVTSGASSTLLDDIESEIAAKRFMDDPEGLKRCNTWRDHKPFRNRTAAEVEFAIGAGIVPKRLEVLWANYESIMTQLENTNKSFYELSFEKQAELIKKLAEELKGELEPDVPEIGGSGFLGNGKAKQEAA